MNFKNKNDSNSRRNQNDESKKKKTKLFYKRKQKFKITTERNPVLISTKPTGFDIEIIFQIVKKRKRKNQKELLEMFIMEKGEENKKLK